MTLSLLFLFLLSFSLSFLLSPIQTQPLSNSTELFALYSLRSSLSIRAIYWPLKSDPCTTWTGVGCLSGRVVSISLTGLRRTRLGKLNPQFSVDGLQNLSLLTTFNASGFYLPGPIPIWFGHHLGSSFTTLDLGFTGVIGTIPAELSLLSNLESLVLSHNNLTGTIPSELGYVPSLSYIDLGFNNLSGNVPDSIWALPELKYLDLSSNQLTGQVPQTLPTHNGTSYTFNISNNLFYGKVSAAVELIMRSFNLSDISNNYFEGSLNSHVKGNMNCFYNTSDQRSLSDCADFYKQRGLLYDQFTSPPSDHAPTIPNLPEGEASYSIKRKSKTKKNKKKYIIAGSIGAAGLVVLITILALVFVCVCRRKNRTQPMSRRGSSLTSVHAQASPLATTPVTTTTGTRNPSALADSFTFDKLARATSDFTEDKCLKHGHTGDIYHGMLEDGSHVAVKRVNGNLVKNEGALGELGFFEKLSHARFVPFLGRVLREEQKEEFFVYRFMVKGDMTGALHKRHKEGEEEENETKPESHLDELPSLDWITRLKIATGVAEALCILHHECNPPIVHRDIQASSILLDDKFEVRLGSLSEVCTQQGDGHYSVFSRILRSSKSLDKVISGPPAACSYDIFCLGKVLLELVTGKLGLSGSDDPATADWIEMALTHITIQDRDSIAKIIDPSLFMYEDHLEEVWSMALVAKSCLNPRPSKRPPARYVLKALENPLRVVREEERTSSFSGRIRTMSNRSSWRGAFHGSWRFGSDVTSSGQIAENRSFRHSIKSQGSEKSFSHKRNSREVAPEPSDLEEGAIEIRP
ncbi:Leucine-rich receptor-like protein kinase family protein [Rhynchospora pubera]|uniref:Leucine-rich receptor-like protein kinase family protein n=1 Tax=Rhynchospora pubera TaxID=906938 RepID=A0AAV8BVZ1_9POAL|nr:Leucine-rich receptor-like protein kinase family protein [Rhynchospora pubera]